MKNLLFFFFSFFQYFLFLVFPGSSAGKEATCHAGDSNSIPGLGISTGEAIGYPLQYSYVFLMAKLVKNLPAMWRPGFNPWRRAWLPTLVFLPVKSPWTEEPGRLQSGVAESDTTERLSTAQGRMVRFYCYHSR